jgi:hypothetical protein
VVGMSPGGATPPPAQQRAERLTPDVSIIPHVTPLIRGADGAARRPYLEQFQLSL